MKLIFLIFLIFIFTNCSKPKTVLICGDHVCINKTEAQQYFEENLTIEVKVINKKIENKVDLVELNLKENIKGKRKISVASKQISNKELKTLSNEEIMEIKEDIKNKEKEKKIANKIFKKEKSADQMKKKAIIKEAEININTNDSLLRSDNKRNNDVVDVCLILKKCSIDEISKYLIKQGKKKGFPDLTKK